MIEMTIVSPAYNEQEGISVFLESVIAELKKLDKNFNYEIVIVDDGSTDLTWREILKCKVNLNENNIKIAAIRLATNYGQMAALDAGMRLANGKYILTMDSDLQHPPRLINEFFSLRVNHPVIVGVQKVRVEKFWKSWLSRKFYRFANLVSGVYITENAGDFRMIDRDTLSQIHAIADQSVVTRFAISKLRIPTLNIEFEARERLYGNSKYNMRKMSRMAFDSLLTLTTKPLKLSLFLSVFIIMALFLQVIYAVYSYFFFNTIPGWSSQVLLASIGFLSISSILTIQGVYIQKIFEISQGFPRYVKKEIVISQDLKEINSESL